MHFFLDVVMSSKTFLLDISKRALNNFIKAITTIVSKYLSSSKDCKGKTRIKYFSFNFTKMSVNTNCNTSVQLFPDVLQNRSSLVIFTRNPSLIKMQSWRPATLLKEAPTRVLSFEYCEIFRSNLFYKKTPLLLAREFLLCQQFLNLVRYII